jgi:hypothetical protein
MRPELIIEGQIPCQPLLGIVNGLVGMEIDLFIFETPPQPFHKHIVPPPPGPIHADLNPPVFENPGEFLAGELAALIRVEDLWLTIVSDRSSRTASTQKSVVNVLDSRHAQLRIAHKYTKPRRIGMYVMSDAHT